MRLLILCLDGTWNRRDDTTNVWRIYSLLAEQNIEKRTQVRYYDEGVGTHWYDSITGGAFGAGVYRNVKEAYNWIAEQYWPDDKICIFGFSRGALTALSLANLIDRCGIIKPESHKTFEEAYRLYQMPGFIRDSPASNRFRSKSADSISHPPLAFLGLFDTVASLYANRLFNESMHVLTLPQSVRCVYHALAIDENRRPFQSVRFPAAPRHGFLVERWFSGAHANVGGGYVSDPLTFAPLAWMMKGAKKEAKIDFQAIPELEVEDLLAVRERNSFEEFGLGLPAMTVPLLFHKRRQIGRKVAGRAQEWIDSSATARYRTFSAYQSYSKSLARYLQATGQRPEGEICVQLSEN